MDTLVDWISFLRENVPGAPILFKYMRKSYQDDPFRTAVEVALIIFAIFYLTAKAYAPRKVNATKISPDVIEERIRYWKPEPLVPKPTERFTKTLEKVPTILGAASLRCEVEGVSGKVVNFVACNYLNIIGDQDIKEAAIESVKKYGVGSCGPPGFYGTIDVHVNLEKQLAEAFGTEQAIIYAQGFSTISSVIPAFAKRGDFIVCDDGVSFAAQKGVQISRSNIQYFKHNDMVGLEQILQRIQEEDIKLKRPLTRRFIIVEGLYPNTGDICNLPKLVELKHKYKFRLIVDETFSIGALGKRGLGVSDHFNVPVSEIDILCGSMSHALGSSGGFCVGSAEVVDHQRLSSAGYCYSASLPALLAISASLSLRKLTEHPQLAHQAISAGVQMRKLLGESNLFQTKFEIRGDFAGPIIHVSYRRGILGTYDEEEEKLELATSLALNDRFLFTVARYVPGHELRPLPPSIRIITSAGHTDKEIKEGSKVLLKSLEAVL